MASKCCNEFLPSKLSITEMKLKFCKFQDIELLLGCVFSETPCTITIKVEVQLTNNSILSIVEMEAENQRWKDSMKTQSSLASSLFVWKEEEERKKRKQE